MRMCNRIFRVYVHRDMQGDGRTDNIYIHIQFTHSHTVYVGLAQARPNNDL